MGSDNETLDDPITILGKMGRLIGRKIDDRATKVSLSNTESNLSSLIDLRATKVSLSGAQSALQGLIDLKASQLSLSNTESNLESLINLRATQVSLANEKSYLEGLIAGITTGGDISIATTTDIYGVATVSISSTGQQVIEAQQISLGLSINAFPADDQCCSLSWGSLTNLTDLRAQVLRNVNYLCTQVNNFNIDEGFEYGELLLSQKNAGVPTLQKGQFGVPVQEQITTITPNGTGGGSTTTNTTGNTIGVSTKFQMYLDTSGSMNYYLGTARNALVKIRNYLQNLYYANSTEAQTYIPSTIELSNERYLEWFASDTTTLKQFNVALINESNPNYSGGISSGTTVQDVNDYISMYQNITATSGAYIKGIVFPMNDDARYVQECLQINSHFNLDQYGLGVEVGVDGSYTEEQLAIYMTNRFNVPTLPSHVGAYLSALEEGTHANKVIWNVSANIYKRTGTYKTNGGIDYTSDSFGVEVYNLDSSGNAQFQAFINFGTTLPTRIIYNTLGTEPTNEYRARIVVKSSTHGDYYSPWGQNTTS